MTNATASQSEARFTSTVCLNDEGPFPTFKEALANFIHRMKNEPGVHSLQLLETACWIQRDSNGTQVPLMFYDARDFGYATGLLGDGAKIILDAPEPDSVLLADLYAAAALGIAEQFIERLKAAKAETVPA